MPRAWAACSAETIPRSDVQRASGPQGAALQDRRERPAVDVLHREEERASRQAPEVGGCGDVRALDVARRDRLPLEAGDDVGHRRPLGQQHLEGEELAQVQMLGAVDDAHPALAEDRVDAVAVGHDVAHRQRARRGRRLQVGRLVHGARPSISRELAGAPCLPATILAMDRPRLVWMAAGGSVAGVLLVVSIGGAARGCRASGHADDLDRRVARIEGALGMGDAGSGVASADAPGEGTDGGATGSDDVSPACAVAKIAAYHAWQDALTKAKSLAAPAQGACADLWSDRKKQNCYYVASAGVRTTQAARDAVVNGGAAARDAVKAVKDDPRNSVIARARAASDRAFSVCGDDAE